MRFRTDSNYGIRERFVDAGSRYKTNFVRHVDIGGKQSLEKVEDTDIHELVQLNAQGNQLCDLISRYLRGDRDAIGDSDSLIFEDLSNAPSDVCEVAERLARVRERFDNLPLDVRSKYNHDLTTFLKAAQDGSMKKEYDEVTKAKRDAAAAQAKAVRDSFSEEQLKKLASIIGGSK